MFTAPAAAASPDVVISQVHGAGGNSGAPVANDYVELFNRGPAAVPLSGWWCAPTAARTCASKVTATGDGDTTVVSSPPERVR